MRGQDAQLASYTKRKKEYKKLQFLLTAADIKKSYKLKIT